MNIDELQKQYEAALLSEWDFDADSYIQGRFAHTAYELMPDLLEAVAVLRLKMNRETNNQENHERALKVLERLDANR